MTTVVTVLAAAPPKLLEVTAPVVLLPNAGCVEVKLKLEIEAAGFTVLTLRCSAVVLKEDAVKPKTGFALSTAFVGIRGSSFVTGSLNENVTLLETRSLSSGFSSIFSM